MKVFGGYGDAGDTVLSWKKEPKNFRIGGSMGVLQAGMVQPKLQAILSLSF